MTAKSSAKPLELVVGGDPPVRFASPEEFAFSLSGRVALPSQKVTALMKRTPRELKEEAGTIDELEQRLQPMLARLEDASGNHAITKFDPAVFSHDHNWRGIITGLNNCGDEYREYKVVALKMYLQYLRSRKVLLMGLYADRRTHALQDDKDESVPDAAGKEMLGATTNSGSHRSTLLDEGGQPAQKNRDKKPAVRRLPKGEPVVISVVAGSEVEIILSRHKFRVANHNGLELIDQAGRHYLLVKGRNIIGRDPTCNISLDPSIKDISRRHLVIENPGNDQLILTDMSSYGTFVVE